MLFVAHRGARSHPVHVRWLFVMILCATAPASAQEPLAVPGYADASILVPPASDRPLPLVIGLHGNFNPDSNFVGITIGGVFGKRRLR